MRVNSVDNAKQLTCVRVSAVFLICLACKVYITEENVGVQAVVSTRTHNFVCTGWTRERERENTKDNVNTLLGLYYSDLVSKFQYTKQSCVSFEHK